MSHKDVLNSWHSAALNDPLHVNHNPSKSQRTYSQMDQSDKAGLKFRKCYEKSLRLLQRWSNIETNYVKNV